MLLQLLVAGLAAAAVTSIELAYAHGRGPMGDHSYQAKGLWLAMLALDGLVAVASVLGLVSTVSLDDAGTSGVVRAGLVGVLAPLALRSPIRQAKIAGAEEGVGITYLYDVARIHIDRALDERMTRIRRRYVDDAVNLLQIQGWTVEALRPLIRRHLDERRKLDPDTRAELENSLLSSTTLPDEESRMRGQVTALLAHHMKALLDELKDTSPPVPSVAAHEVDEDLDDSGDEIGEDLDEATSQPQPLGYERDSG